MDALTQIGEMPSAEEFLCRFGDVIDDRVAEVLDELEARRPRWRLHPGLAALALLLAMGASVVLRQSVLAVCAVWVSTAVVCLAAALATGPGRS